MAINNYGDISPRTAAFAIQKFLERAIPYMNIEQFMDAYPLPTNSTKVAKWRRYNALPYNPKFLTEGVTPTTSPMTSTDVTAVLQQLGDGMTFSDVILDTHEDPVLREATAILGEQAAQMVESYRFGIIKSGTNVFYPNGSARTTLTTTISTAFQRKVTRALKRQNGRQITSRISSSPNYGTDAVAASYVALTHPDLEADIRQMSGFWPTERYGTVTPYESEIGKVEDVRYISSTIYEPWRDAATSVTASNGGTNGNTGATSIALMSTTGTNPDVYPVLYLAQHAIGGVALRGKNSITPMVINPKPSDSDPFAQRGHVTWKTYQAAAILNDMWMVRAEVVASA